MFIRVVFTLLVIVLLLRLEHKIWDWKSWIQCRLYAIFWLAQYHPNHYSTLFGGISGKASYCTTIFHPWSVPDDTIAANRQVITLNTIFLLFSYIKDTNHFKPFSLRLLLFHIFFYFFLCHALVQPLCQHCLVEFSTVGMYRCAIGLSVTCEHTSFLFSFNPTREQRILLSERNQAEKMKKMG